MSKAAPEPGQTFMRGECRSCGRPIERFAGRAGTDWAHEDALTGEAECDPENVTAHRAWKRYRKAAER
jgi:hypothetical protein